MDTVHPIAGELLPISQFREIVVATSWIPLAGSYSLFVSLDTLDPSDTDRLSWHESFRWSTQLDFDAGITNKLLYLCLLEPCYEEPFTRVSGAPVTLTAALEFVHLDTGCTFELRRNFSIGQPDSDSALGTGEDGEGDPDPPAAKFLPDAVDWSRHDAAAAASPPPEDEEWLQSPQRWHEWAPAGMRAASRHLFLSSSSSSSSSAAAAAAAARPCAAREPLEHRFGFPAFVLNLRRRRDRRAHARRLLAALGFANVSLPATTAARDLDVPALLRRGEISAAALRNIAAGLGPAAVRPYAAIAADFVAAVARGAAAGFPLFAVFEDDLAAGACPAETNRRIAAALRELPRPAAAAAHPPRPAVCPDAWL